MSEQVFLGVEIGGTKIQVAAGGGKGRIDEVRKFTVNQSRGATGIQEQVREGVEYFKAKHRIAGIGVGFGGPVNQKTGKVARSHQISGWEKCELRSWAGQLAGAPAIVENDANTAALAEARLGAGRGAASVFYVTLGSGVGGGFVINDQIYHGAVPGESEIGHVRLDPSGTTLEQRCSGWAVDRRIADEINKDPKSRLALLASQETAGQARHLKAAVKAGDPLAQRILHETAHDLAFGLSHVTHLIHPELIVLGGGLSKLGPYLRAAVAAHLRTFLMEVFLPGPQIRIAKLGDQVVPAGALLLAEMAAEERMNN